MSDTTRAEEVRHPGLHWAGGRHTGWCGLCHRPANAGATEGDWWHVWASDFVACRSSDAWFIPDDEATGHTYRERAAHLPALEAAMRDTKRAADSKSQRRGLESDGANPSDTPDVLRPERRHVEVTVRRDDGSTTVYEVRRQGLWEWEP